MIGQNVGKYRILDKLGKGGMGTVYRAIDETLHRDVAIKVLNAELNDPEVAKRFRAEAVTVARLSHPGIAGIYELFEHEGEWLMVMEFVRGETLENMVNRMGPLSAQRAAELCMQTLGALAHAHSMGVVHRDLKPANLMVTETGSVKVMDFGIARVSGAEHLTNAGFMMGTPAYMAPEQVRGGEIDARADIYALGVVFYRLTTAKLPFNGDTAFAMVQSQVNDPPTPIGLLRPDLPPWAAEVVTRALAKAPEQRFQSAAEFHEAFARCLAGLPLSSMYANPSGDPMLTPSRPMPTGAFQARMPTSTGQFPQFPQPGVTTGSQPTMAAPGTNPGAYAAANDPTMLATPVGMPTGAQFGGHATAAQPAGASVTTGAASKKSNLGLLIGVGVILVIGAVSAFVMFGGKSQSSQPSSTDSAGAGGASPSTGGAAAPTGSASTVTPPGPASASSGASTTSKPPQPGSSPAPPATTVDAKPAAPAARATLETDPLVTFSNVKFYVIKGKRATDRDVLINFAGGQVMVMPKNGGEAIFAVPYKKMARATYVKARDPKWDAALPGPPADLDVGSFIRQGRHWLVVQGAEHFAILRLEDNNVVKILETFEARTGLKIERPKVD